MDYFHFITELFRCSCHILFLPPPASFAKSNLFSYKRRSCQLFLYLIHCFLKTPLQFTLPDNNYLPPKLSKPFLFYLIVFDIFIKLLKPEFRSCFVCRRIFAAFMPMPKTAMNKYSYMIL